MKISQITKGWFLVFGALLLLYVLTCAPGSLWQDSGTIQYRVWHNDIEGQLGLALAHPLFYLIAIGAKYIPWGEFAFRVNLVSALAGALAGANLYLLLRLWLGGNLPAVIGALSLGLAHTFWRHAAICETYNLYVALLLGELIVLLQYFRTKRIGYLYALGLLNGLALAVHMLAILALSVYVPLLAVLLGRKVIRIKNAGIIILLWLVGAAPYGYLIAKNIIQSGDFFGTLASAAFGGSYQDDVLNTRVTAGLAKENFLFLLMNFPTPNILLGVVGLGRLGKLSPGRPFKYIFVGLLILFLLFAFRYTIVDRYAFFIPFYVMVAILIGLGAQAVTANHKSLVLKGGLLLGTLLPIPIYMAAPVVAQKIQVNLGVKRKIPYRNNYKYFLQPWRTGERGPEQFAEETFGIVPENAIVYADNTTVYALLYAQEVKGLRPDVQIISTVVGSVGAADFNEQTIGELMARTSVYVVTPVEGYCPKFLLENYEFEQTGVVWQVKEMLK